MESRNTAEPLPVGRAVELRGVTKSYLLFGRRRDRAMALLGRTGGLARVVALQGIDLEVAPGEAVGIIGDNGSGKSTLLRLVAGIASPDAGTVRATPPVAPILELGLGFHPEFTGRQNAVLYGTLLGLDEAAVTERLDEMLAFAELGDFVDQPLRTYSSGMTARLAFAVATNVDPAVLVVDEALAVGDGAFQKKCVDRMVRFREEGRAVLFCSHAMYLVTSFCARAVWLHQGRVRAHGPVKDVVEQYEEHLMQREKRRITLALDGKGPAAAPPHAAPRRARLSGLRVLALDGSPVETLASGSGFQVELEVEALDPEARFHVAVAVDTHDGRCAFAAGTHHDGVPPFTGSTRHLVRLVVPSFPVASGRFSVSGFLFDESGLHAYDQVVVPSAVSVPGERWTPSLLRLEHAWKLPS